MSKTLPIRAVLMSSDIKSESTGFNRLVFRVDGGRHGMVQCAVMISQDAYRKLSQQMARARVQRVEAVQLMKTWARWEISLRLEEHGLIPATITITASDLDDYGAYASNLARAMQLG